MEKMEVENEVIDIQASAQLVKNNLDKEDEELKESSFVKQTVPNVMYEASISNFDVERSAFENCTDLGIP